MGVHGGRQRCQRGLTYSLKTGASDDAAKFAIDAGSGQVSLLQVPDYESGKTGYSFTVVASDLAGNRAEQQVSLSVNDLNDHAPVFTSGASAAVAENVATTTVIYTAQTSDADGTSNNKNVTYALKPGAGDASALSIDAASGAVTFNSPPDVESGKTSYSFTVVATNAGTGATLSRENRW